MFSENIRKVPVAVEPWYSEVQENTQLARTGEWLSASWCHTFYSEMGISDIIEGMSLEVRVNKQMNILNINKIDLYKLCRYLAISAWHTCRK